MRLPLYRKLSTVQQRAIYYLTVYQMVVYMSGVIVMLSGRTKTVHGVSYEFARSANVVHRSLEPFHHFVHSQCSP